MKVTATIAVILLYLSVLAASLYGYVHNIISLINHVGPFTLTEVVRAVGLVAFPIGVVMGYVG